MSSVSQAVFSSWSFDPTITVGLVAALLLYRRGWVILHRTSPERFPGWRALAFAAGLTALWFAIASPLDAFSGFLLSAHMVQHLLLLSVAPPLILLGTPLLPLLRGLPRKFARDGVGPFLTWPALRRAGSTLTHPLSCWIIMAITLYAWHVPAAFDLTLRSAAWHKTEHACFFAASLLFWWPVVRPFPSRPQFPLWLVPLYLLAADLLNTSLSAILTFSDHVLYPHYLEVPRLFGTTALGDQAGAGVIMWVPGSLIFLIPAVTIAVRHLSASERLVRPQPLHSRRTAALPASPLVNAPLQRSGLKQTVFENRFNYFGAARKTVEIATRSHAASSTPLRRGANERGRFDLLYLPLPGPFLRTQFGRRFLQATLLIIAIAVIADGLLGPQVSSANLAGVLPWNYWRFFAVVALLAAGNLFCMVCPFTLARGLARRLGLRPRLWPRALRSKWLAIGLLVLFFWSYETFSLWDKPIWTAWLIINYFLIAFAIDALFSGASFCKYVCPIGQFQFVASLFSPLEVKVREPAVCASCKTHDCLRGNAHQRGCEMDLYLPRKSGNMDCTFCLDCVRACPHDNVGVMAVAPGLDMVRDPQRSSIGRLSRRLDIAALALVFVFAAFANAAFMIMPIADWRDQLAATLGLPSILPVTTTLFFFALIVAPVVLVWSSVLAGRAAAGIKTPMRELIARFSVALVPLAVGMWAAHFLFHFLAGWDVAWPIFHRILGDFGTRLADHSASGFRFRIGDVHILQTILLDTGLLATLYLGWRTARMYAPRLRTAFRIMAPWAVMTAVLYLFGVWACLQPMQMRGAAASFS